MSRHRIAFVLFIIILTSIQPLQAADKPPNPDQFFGHMMGAEGKVIDYFRSLEYYRLIAERSERVLYTELGKTTNGNPFVLLIISSPANLENLDRLRAERDRLSDPRKISFEEAMSLAERLPAVAYHTGAIHSTEISCSMVAPELVYNLATGESREVLRILDNVITLIVPNANPDGLVMIKEWFDAQEGQPWEGRMPWLYHPYVGHDDNRDWIMLHFPEQRLTAMKVHNRWHPIYSLEMHQMGGTGARLFVPPYKDPYDPNTAPQVIETMTLVGTAMSHRLTSEGKGGVVKGAIFDLYTPARAYQVNHGIGRVLTETASANFVRAREVKLEELKNMRRGAGEYNSLRSSWNFPLPWKGGLWTLRDMVEYQLSLNMAALDLVASQPAEFNKAYFAALKRACAGAGGEWPYAYVVPRAQRDPGAAAEMLKALRRGEIEISRATAQFEAGGRRFESGSHVIILRQPYAAWAKSLLETQDYPDLRRNPKDPPVVPYDVTAHSLPLLMGVEVVRIDEPFEAELEQGLEPAATPGLVRGDGEAGYTIDPGTNDAFAVADNLLDAGFQVSRLKEGVKVDGEEIAAGSFIVAPAEGLAGKLKELATERCFAARGLERPLAGDSLVPLRNPRIGIYIPWGGNIDAGWTRLVLEIFDLEYEILRNADFRAGDLRQRFDAIIFADGMISASIRLGSDNWPEEYRGGIGDEGVVALQAFVDNGGHVLAFGRTSMALAEILGIPVANKLSGLSRMEHFSPGSIVMTELDTSSPLAYGLPSELPVLTIWGPALIPDPEATDWQGLRMPATFAKSKTLLSGFMIGQEHLQGAGAIAVQKIGKGGAILFSFRPQFRAMTYGSYRLIFNAVFLACRTVSR